MSKFYQDIYKDAGKNYNPIAVGLKGILIEIGKMEYLKKEENARVLGKPEFCFPSDVRKKPSMYPVESENNRTSKGMESVPDKDFYKEGVYRINKNAKMGQKNKTAIRRLVKSESKFVGEIPHKVFRIHKYKTAGIYDAIYKYLRKSAELKLGKNISDTDKDNYVRDILKAVKDNYTQDFTHIIKYKASEFMTHPYYNNFMKVEFSGKERIKRRLKKFDNITNCPKNYI